MAGPYLKDRPKKATLQSLMVFGIGHTNNTLIESYVPSNSEMWLSKDDNNPLLLPETILK